MFYKQVDAGFLIQIPISFLSGNLSDTDNLAFLTLWNNP
jgi:hypothetical protein